MKERRKKANSGTRHFTFQTTTHFHISRREKQTQRQIIKSRTTTTMDNKYRISGNTFVHTPSLALSVNVKSCKHHHCHGIGKNENKIKQNKNSKEQQYNKTTVFV